MSLYVCSETSHTLSCVLFVTSCEGHCYALWVNGKTSHWWDLLIFNCVPRFAKTQRERRSSFSFLLCIFCLISCSFHLQTKRTWNSNNRDLERKSPEKFHFKILVLKRATLLFWRNNNPAFLIICASQNWRKRKKAKWSCFRVEERKRKETGSVSPFPSSFKGAMHVPSTFGDRDKCQKLNSAVRQGRLATPPSLQFHTSAGVSPFLILLTSSWAISMHRTCLHLFC